MTDYLARSEDVAPPAPDLLVAYQRKVRRAAIRFANERDYCVETVNEFLELVDLAPFRGGDGREFRGTASVTGYYRPDAPALTLEEARALVQVRSTDPDVRIVQDPAQAVVTVHDDRIVMTTHITVVGTRNGATATAWAISSLELTYMRPHRGGIAAALSFRDPMFDHSNVTEVVYTEPPQDDPDADCWNEDDC